MRFLFDVFGAVETKSGIDHDTLLIDKDVGGYARYAVFRGYVATVKEDSIRQLLTLSELRHRFLRLVPRVDRQDNETLVPMLCRDSTEVRSLRTTGRSAIGPKRQQHRPTFELAEFDLVSVEGRELEVRRGLSL